MARKYPLLDRLQSQFISDPELREKCILDSKSKINNNAANRVFDEFPLMIEDTQFAKLLTQYQALLKQCCRRTVREFEKQIIKIACDELLDEKGNLSEQLLQMLDWQDCAAKTDNYQIVCAFVGMINANLASKSEAEQLANQDRYLAMTDLVSRSYGKWVREYMCDNDIEYNESYDTDKFSLSSVALFPIKHPLLAVSFFAGGIAGLGVYGLAKLVQEEYNDNAPLTLPEIPRV